MPEIVLVFLIPKLILFPKPPCWMGNLDRKWWVCGCVQVAQRGVFLHHQIAGPKQHRPDFICIPFIPKYQDSRSYSAPQYNIHSLGHDIAGQEIKLIRVTCLNHVHVFRMRPREKREGIFPKSHNKVVAKVGPESRQRVSCWAGRKSGSKSLPALVHGRGESCLTPNRALPWQGFENLEEEL